MTDQIRQFFRNFSLQQYLIIMIVCIIIFVTIVLLAISYHQAEKVMLELDKTFQNYTELNIIDRVSLVDDGLKLYDNELNSRMNMSFRPFLDAYISSSGDLSKIDYPEVQQKISLMLSGTVDLYVINRSGIIIRSTVPEVLYLNLSQNPDYAQRIPELIDGSSFAADRVVRSYTSADAKYLNGTLRKFGFVPTPDHQYLLEIGVSDLPDVNERSNLSYYLISDEVNGKNPFLDNIRFFDVHKNQFVKDSVIPPDTLDPITNSRLDEVIRSRSDQEYPNEYSGQLFQYLFIDQSGPDSVSDMSIIVEIVYSDTPLKKEREDLINFFSIVGIIAVFIGIILTIWCSRLLTKPIIAIIEDVDLIAQGDLDHRIRSVKVKEFARLEQSINLMIHRIRTSSEEIERRKAELSIAADIQQSFLPETLPRIEGYDIAAINIPAKEVGGDFYDFIRYEAESGEKNTYGVVIADVSGKGVPAALFMALSRTIVRITANCEGPTTGGLTKANEYITADSRTGMFVSLFYGVITDGKDRMTYVNAGHNPPVVYHASDQTTELLHEGGIVLGVDDSIQLNEEEIYLHPGDIVVFYTDGVTEAIDQWTCMYGEEKLCSVIAENAHRSATEIIDAILKNHSSFTGEGDQFDDITLIVLKRTSSID